MEVFFYQQKLEKENLQRRSRGCMLLKETKTEKKTEKVLHSFFPKFLIGPAGFREVDVLGV